MVKDKDLVFFKTIQQLRTALHLKIQFFQTNWPEKYSTAWKHVVWVLQTAHMSIQ